VVQRMRARSESPVVALAKVWGKARRRFGGHIAHYGVLLVVLSLALAKGYRTVRDYTMQKGETVQFEDWEVTFDGARLDKQAHRDSLVASYRVSGMSRVFEPRMNYYPNSQQPIATPAVRSSLKEDLYLTLMAFDQEQGRHATVRAIVNPAVPWLWIGGMIVALGGILAVAPQRKGGRPALATVFEEEAEARPEPSRVAV